MKKLSIEQKAKAYDEKLDVARHIYADPSVQEEDKYYIEVIFPELAESEDEQIRKALINGFNKFDKSAVWYNGITNTQILDWLEKQGKIIKEWSEMKINNIQTELQEMVDLKQKTEQGEQKPAWSEEDEKLVKNLISTLSNLYARNLIEKETKEKYTNLLKSLKDRVQPKQEWSDVDNDILFRIINDLKFLRDDISKDTKYAVNIIDIEREITWLKSLRPQNKWRPSESDILLLESISNGKSNPQDFQASLGGLIGQLKKLREE